MKSYRQFRKKAAEINPYFVVDDMIKELGIDITDDENKISDFVIDYFHGKGVLIDSKDWENIYAELEKQKKKREKREK